MDSWTFGLGSLELMGKITIELTNPQRTLSWEKEGFNNSHSCVGVQSEAFSSTCNVIIVHVLDPKLAAEVPVRMIAAETLLFRLFFAYLHLRIKSERKFSKGFLGSLPQSVGHNRFVWCCWISFSFRAWWLSELQLEIERWEAFDQPRNMHWHHCSICSRLENGVKDLLEIWPRLIVNKSDGSQMRAWQDADSRNRCMGTNHPLFCTSQP